MFRATRSFAVLAILFALTACAGLQEIPYDRASAGEIKTVGVLSPALPDKPRVVLASTVGQSFGLIGLLVDASLESNRNSALTSLLSAQNFIAHDEFVHDLTDALQARGYAVALIPVSREKAAFLQHYPPPTNIPADAYLDVVAAYGYVAAGIGSSTPYRPYIIVACKLIRAGDGAVLMQEAVAYNPINPRDKIVTVAPDATYQFQDFDTLMADPQKTAAGMRAAFGQTADTIGTLLR